MKKIIQSVVALSLSMLLGAMPATAGLVPLAGEVTSPIALPPAIGWITDTHAALNKDASKPDVILIQDLHVNRSVQFAISKILGHLKSVSLLPETIAIEGAAGPVDLQGLPQLGGHANAKTRPTTWWNKVNFQGIITS